MTGFVYAAYLIYALLGVLVVAFLVWVGPSLMIELAITARNLWNWAVKLERVERLLLAVEEMREWRSTPGRHRHITHGVFSPDETYFADLIEEWAGLEEELRHPTKVKELVNV